jgi:hypothetical protein
MWYWIRNLILVLNNSARMDLIYKLTRAKEAGE